MDKCGESRTIHCMGFTNAEAKDSLPVMQAVGKTQPCFGGQRSTTADVKTT